MTHRDCPRSGRYAARKPWTFALAALTMLAGCGGGLSIGFGFGDGWDDPPEVTLVASVEAGLPGDSVRLSAAALDDYGIDHVRLYRIEDNGALSWQGTDFLEPYAWTVVLPTSPSGRARFVARAIDGAGQGADSNPVEIMLR